MNTSSAQNIKKWVDNIDTTHQIWLKDYLNQKLKTVEEPEKEAKNYYVFDYRYASNFPAPTPSQTTQLRSIGAEIMFIYDTINHFPIQIKPISGTKEANHIATNQNFWGELMRGYVDGMRRNYGVNSIIGPASGGLIVYAPSNQEHKIFRILDQIEGNGSMVGIDDVIHETISGQSVIHVKVDAMG